MAIKRQGTPIHNPFYQNWLGEPVLVHENAVDCDDCLMTQLGDASFNPDFKCCTHFPFIPNFTLGALLEDQDHGVLLRVQTALKQGLITPLGLFASQEYEAKVREFGVLGFGRKPELLCPFFDSARLGCAIWSKRPGVCSSFFCQSSHGFENWQRIDRFLNLFEWTLAHEVLWRVGFTQDDIRIMEEARHDPGKVKAAWQEYQGREEELFRRLHHQAMDVSAQEVWHLIGDDGATLYHQIKTEAAGPNLSCLYRGERYE